MVAESFAPDASVSKVAQRYGVNANLLFTWRRRDARSAASGGAEAVELLPVRVDDERALAAPVARMETVLAARERILVGADVTRRRWRAWSRPCRGNDSDPGSANRSAPDGHHLTDQFYARRELCLLRCLPP
jgi:transposase-like protein